MYNQKLETTRLLVKLNILHSHLKNIHIHQPNNSRSYSHLSTIFNGYLYYFQPNPLLA